MQVLAKDQTLVTQVTVHAAVYMLYNVQDTSY